MPTVTFDHSPTRSDPAVRALNDFRRAEVETASVIRGTLACDSAAAVYRLALETVGVDTSELARHPGALRAAWQGRGSGTRPRIAMDAATDAERLKRFPNFNRLGYGA